MHMNEFFTELKLTDLTLKCVLVTIDCSPCSTFYILQLLYYLNTILKDSNLKFKMAEIFLI